MYNSRFQNIKPQEISSFLADLNWPTITEIVSGTASGVDKAGEAYARTKELYLKKFPANWGLYGKAAGPIRNRDMAKYADALLLIWDGKSKGSKNMLNEMKRLGKLVKVVVYEDKV